MNEVKESFTEANNLRPKWATGKLVLGILSMVFFVIVTFQSCAVGIGNSLSGNGEVSGSGGFLAAINMLASGIIAVAARKSIKKAPMIIATVLLWINYLFGVAFSGSFADLKIWGFLSFAFGVVYLLSTATSKKQTIVVIIISAIYFALFYGLGNINAPKTQQENYTVDESASSEKPLSFSTNKTAEKTDLPTIQEQNIVDQDGVKVTVKEYIRDSIWGDGIKVLIENNSAKNIGVSSDEIIINDYMISNLFSSTVAPGKKANDTIYFMSSSLKEAGIEKVGQIELYLHLFDGDTYMTISHVPCAKILTSYYDEMSTSANITGNELYNDSGIRIVGKSVSNDSIFGTGLILYIENNCGKNVIVQCDDLSVNGYMMTPLFSSTVYNGKKAISEITLLSNELEENDISRIENVELIFKIIDADTYSTIKETAPISFELK